MIFEVPITADRTIVLKVGLLTMAWSTAPESVEAGLFPVETGATMFRFFEPIPPCRDLYNNPF